MVESDVDCGVKNKNLYHNVVQTLGKLPRTASIRKSFSFLMSSLIVNHELFKLMVLSINYNDRKFFGNDLDMLSFLANNYKLS